jgi:hypothetical protein
MTSSSQYLEIEHCHAVCAELREQLTKTKLGSESLAREVDAAYDRIGVLADHIQELMNARSVIGNHLIAVKSDRELLLATLEMVLPHLGFESYTDKELIDGGYDVANVLIPARAAITRVRDRDL